MMYYVNWVLTNAQLELIAADVSVVDYDYGKKGKKNRKKSSFDDTPASYNSIVEANERWLSRYGDDKGARLSANDILGGLKTGVGLRIE